MADLKIIITSEQFRSSFRRSSLFKDAFVRATFLPRPSLQVDDDDVSILPHDKSIFYLLHFIERYNRLNGKGSDKKSVLNR